MFTEQAVAILSLTDRAFHLPMPRATLCDGLSIPDKTHNLHNMRRKVLPKQKMQTNLAKQGSVFALLHVDLLYSVQNTGLSVLSVNIDQERISSICVQAVYPSSGAVAVKKERGRRG